MGKVPYPPDMPDEGWPEDEEPLEIRDVEEGGKVPYPEWIDETTTGWPDGDEPQEDLVVEDE